MRLSRKMKMMAAAMVLMSGSWAFGADMSNAEKEIWDSLTPREKEAWKVPESLKMAKKDEELRMLRRNAEDEEKTPQWDPAAQASEYLRRNRGCIEHSKKTKDCKGEDCCTEGKAYMKCKIEQVDHYKRGLHPCYIKLIATVNCHDQHTKGRKDGCMIHMTAHNQACGKRSSDPQGKPSKECIDATNKYSECLSLVGECMARVQPIE